jgi:multicomponent Na+:H+ antiporter subunit B
MTFPVEVFLFAILVVSGVLVARLHNLFAAAMVTGLFSLASAALFTLMDAVDVAFTEAAVGAGISTVLVLGTLAVTDSEEKDSKPTMLPLIVVLLTGVALVVGTLDMAPYGSPDATIHQRVSKQCIENEYAMILVHEAESHPESAVAQQVAAGKIKKPEKAVGLPNIVTSILASYRGYDTLGETAVIFTAGVGVMLLLVRVRRREDDPGEEA